MISVVDMEEIGRKACRSLNFILVGYGKNDAVQTFLKYANKRISEHIATQPVMLYSQKTLNLAETKPNLLCKSAVLPLRTPHNTSNKEYTGFVNSVDPDKLYQYLYSSFANPITAFQRPPYYSQRRLSSLIHEKFGTVECDTDGMLGDMEVRFIQNSCEQEKSYIRIEYKISDMLIKDFSCCVARFRCLVEELDSLCPETLKTAYISFTDPQMPIIHERVYDSYNIEQVECNILGAEWYVYFNKRIAERLDASAYEGLAKLTKISQMQNGVSYTATNEITEFNSSLRQEISRILRDILIPAVGVYEWSRLYNQRWKVLYLPQKIDVYHDSYNPKDPTVVLSYNYNTDQLAGFKGLSRTDLMDSFMRD